jgi:GGDEF domain-containing protein
VNENVRHLLESKVIQINRDLADAQDGLPPLSVSVGISMCDDKASPQEMFHNADIALYYVKENGRNGCCFYEPGMREHSKAK